MRPTFLTRCESLNDPLLCWEKEDTGAGKEEVWKKGGGRGHGGRGVALGGKTEP